MFVIHNIYFVMIYLVLIGHYPRHAKKYVDIEIRREKLQELRIKGFKMFLDDI